MRGLAHDLDEARDRKVDSARAVEDVAAFEQRRPGAAAGEVVEGGLARGEGVGFVLETADGDAHKGRDS